MSRTIIYFNVYIILYLPITHNNGSVLCQSECACLHKTVNMEVFFVKSNEIPNQKGEQIHANVLSRPYNKKKDCVKDKGALI